MAPLKIIGVEGSHDTLRAAVADREPGKILDVPAGEGIFCDYLNERGWEVHAADIDQGNFKLTDVPFKCVNLNKTLPYPDESFDAVSCVNGLHRLLFPGAAIQEFFRILRPGGTLFVNLNNYASMAKRLRFLFLGSIDEAIDSQHCIQTIDDPEAHVRLPLLYPQLKGLLEDSGFEVIDLLPAAVGRRDRLLRPASALIRLAGKLFARNGKTGQSSKAANEFAVLSGGTYFFVELKKPAQSSES